MKDPGGTIGSYVRDPGTCPGGYIVRKDPGTGGRKLDPGTGGH